MSNTDANPPARPPLTGGSIILLIIGGLLLLFPGGCSLYFLITALPEIFRAQNNGYLIFIYVPVAIGFALAALGFWLVRIALRTQRNSSS